MDEMAVFNRRSVDLRYLHVRCRDRFKTLKEMLARDFKEARVGVLFDVFEAYRTPHRQTHLADLESGVTGARAYESAHQYGWAVDFVAKIDGIQWSWDGSHPWDHLAKRANECGLVRPYSWDLAHIEDPTWSDWRHVMRSL